MTFLCRGKGAATHRLLYDRRMQSTKTRELHEKIVTVPLNAVIGLQNKQKKARRIKQDVCSNEKPTPNI